MSVDPLDRVWAAMERIRAAARGGRGAFREAVDEHDELLAAIAASRRYPVADVAAAAGVSPARIRDLRQRAEACEY